MLSPQYADLKGDTISII